MKIINEIEKKDIVAVKSSSGFVTNDPDKAKEILRDDMGAERVNRNTAAIMHAVFGERWRSFAFGPRLKHL